MTVQIPYIHPNIWHICKTWALKEYNNHIFHLFTLSPPLFPLVDTGLSNFMRHVWILCNMLNERYQRYQIQITVSEKEGLKMNFPVWDWLQRKKYVKATGEMELLAYVSSLDQISILPSEASFASVHLLMKQYF